MEVEQKLMLKVLLEFAELIFIANPEIMAEFQEDFGEDMLNAVVAEYNKLNAFKNL